MKKIWILIFLLFIGGVGFLYFSPMFEKNPPKILINSNGFTNLKDPIKIEIKDDSGIKEYDVVMLSKGIVKTLISVANPSLGKDVTIEVKLPKVSSKNIKLIVRAKDTSKWHFFAGNESKKEITLTVDTIAPDAEIVNNSYAIGRGGSAVAIVEVKDEHLKDKYILVNGKYKFKLTPFVKEGYYISLIVWPYNESSFNANLVVIDEANNKTIVHIPYYWRIRGIYKPKPVKINISDKFINTVAKRVLEKMGMDIPNDPIEIFKTVNEKVRKINEKEIKRITTPTDENKITSFYIRRFNPLPGSAKKAGFNEIRHYFYNSKEISIAIHKGIDLAKIKRAKIYASNVGKVVAAKWIGIYGNTLILYHGLGLYSSYSHTSEFLKKVGDSVNIGEVIVRSGATGAVFGDHLHFGIYIQGIPVNPLEWMDSHWIKINILNVIRNARKMILK